QWWRWWWQRVDDSAVCDTRGVAASNSWCGDFYALTAFSAGKTSFAQHLTRSCTQSWSISLSLWSSIVKFWQCYAVNAIYATGWVTEPIRTKCTGEQFFVGIETDRGARN